MERFLRDKRCIIQIQNTDDMCCARAIVTAKAKIDVHEWHSIRHGRRIQEELALELHAKAGVPLHQCGIEDVKTFQRFLVGYQIHVILREHFSGIVYPFVTVCTEVVTTQERSHTGNHIVVVVMIVQVYLLLGCGSMVNDSAEMLSQYHMYLISYQESLKCFYIFDSALM
jgi:hypothetical protein